MITRRAFVVTLAGGLLVIPLAAQGQPGGIPRVGYLVSLRSLS